jgi:hypothetical protein
MFLKLNAVNIKELKGLSTYKYNITNMVQYECPRCGYATKLYSDFRSHLERKTLCEPNKLDLSVEEMLEFYDDLLQKKTEPKKYTCEHCNKEFKTRQSKYKHKQRCTSIPSLSTSIQIIEETSSIQNIENKLMNQNKLLQEQLNQNSILQEKINELKKQEATSSKHNEIVEKMRKMQVELLYYKNRKNENFYQALLEDLLSGNHKTLPSGVTDVTNDDCHAEIKAWDCWKEAIGQLWNYNKDDPKDNLCVYMFGKYSRPKDLAIKRFQECGFKVFEFRDLDDGSICIQDLINNEICHTYKPQ